MRFEQSGISQITSQFLDIALQNHR